MYKTSSAIRSFVRREGRFTKAQRAAFKNYWSIYGIDIDDQPLNFQNLFSNAQPVIFDIGFGNGEALRSLATQHLDLNFIGVEVYRPGIGVLLRKLAEAELSNVRVVNIDAVELLQKNIATNSLASVLIWFPDPWPKKRHHKRRLIQSEFLQLVASKLISKGELNIATDWQPYADHIQDIIKQSSLFELIDASSFINQRSKTKFERRGEKLGHQVFSNVYKKIN